MKLSHGVIGVVLVVARAASAQPAGAQAEVLFKEGKALMTRGKLAEACAAFDASQRLEAATTTLVNLADCREKNQQFATAWGLYLQAERELRALTDDAGVKLRELVKTRAAKLEPRLSMLTINVPAASRVNALEIIRENDRVDPGAWNHPLPVDGGSFRISARAPDRREWTTLVTMKPEGDTQSIDIPALVTTARPDTTQPPSPVVTTPVTVRARAPDAPLDAPRRGRSLKLPIVFGATALGLGLGALGLELWGNQTYADAKADPDVTRQEQLWKSANHRRYAAEAVGVAAAGALGAAIYFYVRGRGDETPVAAKSGVTVSPVAGTGISGVQLEGRW